MTLEELYIALFWLCLYMAPLAFVAASPRTKDNEKTGWLLATILFSWFALIAYWSTAPNKKERKKRHQEQMTHKQKVAEFNAAKQLHQRREDALAAALKSTGISDEIAPIEDPENTTEGKATNKNSESGDRGEV
ncbi:MAG: hypothetical protein ACI8WB_000439 [Phenylobacterium sp.]|jgi:hypothetical protein